MVAGAWLLGRREPTLVTVAEQVLDMMSGQFPELAAPAKATFVNPIREFYLTNPIARASTVMGELAAMARARADKPLAAE